MLILSRLTFNFKASLTSSCCNASHTSLSIRKPYFTANRTIRNARNGSSNNTSWDGRPGGVRNRLLCKSLKPHWVKSSTSFFCKLKNNAFTVKSRRAASTVAVPNVSMVGIREDSLVYSSARRFTKSMSNPNTLKAAVSKCLDFSGFVLTMYIRWSCWWRSLYVLCTLFAKSTPEMLSKAMSMSLE